MAAAASLQPTPLLYSAFCQSTTVPYFLYFLQVVLMFFMVIGIAKIDVKNIFKNIHVDFRRYKKNVLFCAYFDYFYHYYGKKYLTYCYNATC